uniref:RRM domain-containing protein n=1 Tax=Panagrellus redivivus TaxID=6233 RepID=A0A7E4VN92_PANRE
MNTGGPSGGFRHGHGGGGGHAHHTPEQSLRSVFVGNIAYAVTEEELTDLFKTVGQVIKFRLVRDRDTQKPKGFGFCEFTDVATAETAIRNLNNFDFHGRLLKVDSAVNSSQEKNTGGDDFISQTCTVEPDIVDIEEPMYGPAVDPEHVLEAITHAVTTFPAEKMFAVMKEMREMALTDPELCRNFLMQNPQLSYALLQLQVVMRTINAKDAVSMLYPEQPQLDYPFYKASADDDSESFAPAAAFHAPLPERINVTSHRTLLPNPPKPIVPKVEPAPAAMPGPSAASPKPDEQVVEDAELLVQVMRLQDHEIDQLPEEYRRKVQELRERLKNEL